ncbi:MAG: AbgT family transporter [Lachnospiraceae bacterium]|nr:AbgT family transporter [Lachnospiraceae bacterium]
MEKESRLIRFTKRLEKLGNKLPHPLLLSVFLLAALYLLSFILAKAGVSVDYEQQGVIQHVSVVNLLSRESLRDVITGLTSIYQSNSVLPAIIIICMFTAVANESGFFSAFLRRLISGVPAGVTTYILALCCLSTNIMSDAGILLAITLGASIYKALGRDPWIGIMLGFSGFCTGFVAHVIPSNTNILNYTITNASSAAYGVELNPLSTYYFEVAATFLAALVLTFMCEKVLPRLFYGGKILPVSSSEVRQTELSPEEKRGLRVAGYGFLVFLALMLLLTVPPHAFFRNDDGTLLPKSPLISSIVPLLSFLFLLLGVCYGKGSGTVHRAEDVIKMMIQGVKNIATIIIVFFPISVLIYSFNHSNLQIVLASLGERFFRSIGVSGLPLLYIFILFLLCLTFFTYGGSIRWAIFAPLCVPLFLKLGIHPAMTQAAYRIADSCGGAISPIYSAIPLILSYMEENRDSSLHAEKPGIGTVLSVQLPMSAAMLLALTALLTLFWLLGLPLGVGYTN